MRVTDAETMDVVEMVLGGQVNSEIVGSSASTAGARPACQVPMVRLSARAR